MTCSPSYYSTRSSVQTFFQEDYAQYDGSEVEDATPKSSESDGSCKRCKSGELKEPQHLVLIG